MEEAAAVRRAAREAVRDVAPEDLRAAIEGFIAAGSVAPGVLVLLCAGAATDRQVSSDDDIDGLVERAAGVQLIYDGLRLTRELAHAEPWASENEHADADMNVLAADVLVARGFYLLARTDAAETAVEVVRAFGRDQTRRRTAGDREVLDRNLETDVLELAAVAGATAAGRESDDLREFAADLAATCDGSFPDPETLFSETVTDRLAGLAADGGRTL